MLRVKMLRKALNLEGVIMSEDVGFSCRFGTFNNFARVAVIAACVSLAGADTDRSKTADGVAFDPPESRIIQPDDLPFVRRWLDGQPGEVGQAKIWSIGAAKGPAVRWRKMLEDNQIKWDTFQYITDGMHGAEAVLIGAENGRVKSLCFFYPSLSPSKVKLELSPLAKIADKATATDDTFRILKGKTSIFGSLVGSHSFDVTTHRQLSLNEWAAGGGGDDLGVSHHQESYFSGIQVEVSPIEWDIVHNHVSTEIAAGMRSGSLVPGMTEAEAELATGITGKVVSVSDGTTTVDYVRSHQVFVKEETQGGAVLSSASDIHERIQEAALSGPSGFTYDAVDVHLQATFDDGKLASFIDAK